MCVTSKQLSVQLSSNTNGMHIHFRAKHHVEKNPVYKEAHFSMVIYYLSIARFLLKLILWLRSCFILQRYYFVILPKYVLDSIRINVIDSKETIRLYWNDLCSDDLCIAKIDVKLSKPVVRLCCCLYVS